MSEDKLAILGGSKTVTIEEGDMFAWPIVTKEHEEALLGVLRSGSMSGLAITEEFEAQYAKTIGRKYAIACNNGTAAIHCCFYGMGVGVGCEVICPSITFWASIVQVYSLGATAVFADIDPDTLCLDPNDIEHRISPRTKAIVVTHYAGMPADMDAILAVAGKHNLKVLEDCSHAHGSLYKGRQVGTFGDAAGFSLMSAKAFPIGEGGIMFTDDQRIYERALLFGHYARHHKIELEDLKQYAGLPCGGYKYRLNQFGSALGLVQLKLYPSQTAEIDRAMNYFCDLIEDLPGIKPIRCEPGTNSTKGGWYYPRAKYDSAQLGGLSIRRFVDAINAEGSRSDIGGNAPLHLHPLFTKMDVYGHGRATRVAYLPESVGLSQPAGSLPISEQINGAICGIPWFRHFRPEVIKQHADAFRKVVVNHTELLRGDTTEKSGTVSYSSFRKDV